MSASFQTWSDLALLVASGKIENIVADFYCRGCRLSSSEYQQVETSRQSPDFTYKPMCDGYDKVRGLILSNKKHSSGQLFDLSNHHVQSECSRDGAIDMMPLELPSRNLATEKYIELFVRSPLCLGNPEECPDVAQKG